MIIFLLIIIAVGVLLISDGGQKILAWVVALSLIAIAFIFSKRFVTVVFYGLCSILGLLIIGTALSFQEFRDNIGSIIAFAFIACLVYKKFKSGDFKMVNFKKKDFIGKVGTIGLALIIPLIVLLYIYTFFINDSVKTTSGLNLQQMSGNQVENNQPAISNQLNANELKAINLVRNLPDVQKWLSLFPGVDYTSPSTNSRAIITIDSEKNGIYTIHAFESLPDHEATFNWYTVNIATKEVRQT